MNIQSRREPAKISRPEIRTERAQSEPCDHHTEHDAERRAKHAHDHAARKHQHQLLGPSDANRMHHRKLATHDEARRATASSKQRTRR